MAEPMGTTKKTPKTSTKVRNQGSPDVAPRFAPMVAAFSSARGVGLGRLFGSKAGKR
jgi:hypothetical protein